MKFLLQVRFNGAGTVIGALPAGEQQKVTDEFIAIRQSPGVLDGNRLRAAGEAATVRMDDDGKTQVTTGPAAEAGSELDGYYVYDAPGLDAAIAFAAQDPCHPVRRDRRGPPDAGAAGKPDPAERMNRRLPSVSVPVLSVNSTSMADVPPGPGRSGRTPPRRDGGKWLSL